MGREKRHHDAAFKASIALEAIRGRYAIKEIAANFNLNPSLVHAWKQQLLSSAAQLFGSAAPEGGSAEERRLERKIRELTTEQEWMRRAMSRMSLRDKRACVDPLHPDVSILAQSRLLGLHRSGIYYKSRVRDGRTADENGEYAPAAADAAATADIRTASEPANEGDEHVRR